MGNISINSSISIQLLCYLIPLLLIIWESALMDQHCFLRPARSFCLMQLLQLAPSGMQHLIMSKSFFFCRPCHESCCEMMTQIILKLFFSAAMHLKRNPVCNLQKCVIIKQQTKHYPHHSHNLVHILLKRTITSKENLTNKSLSGVF